MPHFYLFKTTNYANYAYIGYATYLCVLWMFFNYGGSGLDPYKGSGFRWLLITTPLFIYLAINFLLLISKPFVDRNFVTLFLLLYLLCTLLASGIKADIKHFSEIVRWVLPIMFICHFKVYMPVNILNALYLFAVVTIFFTFDPSDSDYGFLPGQTTTNLHQGLWWRVSIWKYMTPPYSAAFSIIVYFANYFLNKSASRYILYSLSIYFLVLSASRTGYFVFAICLSVVLFRGYFTFKFRLLYILIPIFSVAAIFLLQFFSDLLPMLGIRNEFLTSALLRNPTSSGDAGNLSSRFNIILEHLRLVTEAGASAVFGLGSEVYASPAWRSNGGHLGGTADSNVSHLIVRDGLAIVFLVLSFVFLFVESMKNRNIAAYIVLLALLLYTIGYGAWLNLTSPVYVIYLGFIYQPMMLYLDNSLN